MSNKQLRADEQPADLQDDLDRDVGIIETEGLFGRTAEENAELNDGGDRVEGDGEDGAGMNAVRMSE